MFVFCLYCYINHWINIISSFSYSILISWYFVLDIIYVGVGFDFNVRCESHLLSTFPIIRFISFPSLFILIFNLLLSSVFKSLIFKHLSNIIIIISAVIDVNFFHKFLKCRFMYLLFFRRSSTLNWWMFSKLALTLVFIMFWATFNFVICLFIITDFVKFMRNLRWWIRSPSTWTNYLNIINFNFLLYFISCFIHIVIFLKSTVLNKRSRQRTKRIHIALFYLGRILVFDCAAFVLKSCLWLIKHPFWTHNRLIWAEYRFF